MNGITGTFFIARAGSQTFENGMIGGAGLAVIAEHDEYNNVGVGFEADFFRARRGGAFTNELLPGTQGVGGLMFVSPVGQIDTVVVPVNDDEGPPPGSEP